MSSVSAALDRYGAIAIGLAIGTAARYGMSIGDGKSLSVRTIVADFLLLGMLGCIAVTITDWAHLTGNAKVLAGALTAVSSDRLIRQIRTRFEKKVLAVLDVNSQPDDTPSAV